MVQTFRLIRTWDSNSCLSLWFMFMEEPGDYLGEELVYARDREISYDKKYQ